MDLIEQYLNHIAAMKMSSDDYGDRRKVRSRNRHADKVRKLAAVIDQKHPELKDRFLCLIESENLDVRSWAAHHVIEVMSYDLRDRRKALRVITDVSKNSPDSLQRMGNAMWLKRYYEEHPEDME